MPRSKDRDTRRDELSDAVQRVVATRGLEGVRLRDIADEIGVTPAAVLYHGDVNELTYETYRRAIERFGRATRARGAAHLRRAGAVDWRVSSSGWPADPMTP